MTERHVCPCGVENCPERGAHVNQAYDRDFQQHVKGLAHIIQGGDKARANSQRQTKARPKVPKGSFL
jgi:hypothetical protein